MPFKKDPSKNPENRLIGKNRPEDVLQPFKNSSTISGRIVVNKKFFETYGGDKAKEFAGDPELRKWLERKYSPKGKIR